MKNYLITILFLSIMSSTACSYAALHTFVTIPPQKWLVERIGGELVTTSVLIEKGQDPHSFKPTPQIVALLSKASLWFTLDMDFENHLIDKITKVAPELRIIDITHHIEKLEMPNDDHKEHAHHGGHDPHVWLSPENLLTMAAEVEEALTDADPTNSEKYKKNREELEKELEQLHLEISWMLAPLRGASFYVFHPSFGYFAHTYGLEQHAIELEGKSPSPRQLSRLINKAKTENVKVIFVQPQFDARSGQVIASAIGGEVVPLDSLAEDVAGNLRIIAERIRAALTQ